MTRSDEPQRRGSKRTTNNSRAKYLKQRALSNSLISGPGMFFTCPRGKEAASVYELRDLLERVAEKIKPTAIEEDRKEGVVDSDEEEESAMVESEDIETQIQKELEELKAGQSGSERNISQSSNQRKLRQKFEGKKMDCDCLGFISFPKAYDPVEFATHIVHQIQRGESGYGLRFIQRITPVSMTCSANSQTEFDKMVTQVLKPYFGIKSCSVPNEADDRVAPVSPRVGLKFRIEPIVRCHDKPLNRVEVIRITGDVINGFNADEYISVYDECSVGLDTSNLRHRVSINDAQVVILISVYRYVAGVSVVEGYDKEGKRFNLRTLAETWEKEAGGNMQINP